ncbi:MAG: hypothetical protein ACE5G6_00505 [Terriglobia bacterium]
MKKQARPDEEVSEAKPPMTPDARCTGEIGVRSRRRDSSRETRFVPEEAVNKFCLVGRGTALLAIAGVAAGLAVGAHWRNLTMVELFWGGIIPLVPLLLLAAPHFWRNICPLATLNLTGDRLARWNHTTRSVHLPRRTARGLKRFGVALAAGLLWLLVPLRLLLLNESAWATFFLIVAFVAVAVAMGIALPRKAGWCSGLCPLYPVEKFYSTAPLWTLPDPRCAPANLTQKCFRCTLHCLDVPLSEARYWRAMAAAPSHRLSSGLRDFFLGSFPGFVLAYLLLLNFADLSRPTVSAVAAVYGTFFLLMLGSYGLYWMAHWALAGRQAERSRLLWSRRVDLITVLLALNIYYLIGGAGLAEVLSKLTGWTEGQQFALTLAVVTTVLLVSLYWLYRAWHSRAPPWARW